MGSSPPRAGSALASASPDRDGDSDGAAPARSDAATDALLPSLSWGAGRAVGDALQSLRAGPSQRRGWAALLESPAPKGTTVAGALWRRAGLASRLAAGGGDAPGWRTAAAADAAGAGAGDLPSFGLTPLAGDLARRRAAARPGSGPARDRGAASRRFTPVYSRQCVRIARSLEAVTDGSRGSAG